jgi:cytochrome o ubiquinol oxidase operon protein cyoD
MSEDDSETDERGDAAPGDRYGGPAAVSEGVRNYLIGLGLAVILTIGSFWVASGTSLIYRPGVPMALAAFAVAQMGVHLAFFLHITTGPDNTNNALALAFGALIVGIVIAGSLWIMYHLNANMMAPMDMASLRLIKAA